MSSRDEGDPEELDFSPQDTTTRFEETVTRLDKLVQAAQIMGAYKYKAMTATEPDTKRKLWVKYYAAEKKLEQLREALMEVVDV